ncbi:hypothetical protein LAZ67_14002182 [Cordylochernes scorpioides]|uniref:Integrase catalytic domain-containing protein n=1 Tax=Cordylochernes scorpioides TaxID=51811 RepID=A0ABY6L6R9_9ARAC|nr:hypothetical protein LAZ67_14002182 [Cordylochernes scorpioides]
MALTVKILCGYKKRQEGSYWWIPKKFYRRHHIKPVAIEVKGCRMQQTSKVQILRHLQPPLLLGNGLTNGYHSYSESRQDASSQISRQHLITEESTGSYHNRSDKQRWRNKPAAIPPKRPSNLSPTRDYIFQEQAVNTPTTHPEIPQNKPVRSFPIFVLTTQPPSRRHAAFTKQKLQASTSPAWSVFRVIRTTTKDQITCFAAEEMVMAWFSKPTGKIQDCRSCHTCQFIKRPKGKPYGDLGQILPPQKPFDLISIDTIAGFSEYGHSKTYLHVIVDHLTRYAWTFPSKSTSTLTYIQTLKTVTTTRISKSEFNHLTPDIFETQLFRIIPPTTSQPFLHLNPDLFNIDRFKTNLK